LFLLCFNKKISGHNKIGGARKKLGELPPNAHLAMGLALLSGVSKNFEEGCQVIIIEVMSDVKERGPKRVMPS